MLQHNVNNSIFNRHPNSSLVRAGSRKLSGNEFQTDRPATKKARWPNVLSKHRRTTSNTQVADWRCCLDETSETNRETQQVLWCLAVQTTVRHDAKFECDSFSDVKPVKLWVEETWQVMVVLVGNWDHMKTPPQPTVSEQWRKKYHIPQTCSVKHAWISSNLVFDHKELLVVTLGRVVKPLVSPLMLVPHGKALANNYKIILKTNQSNKISHGLIQVPQKYGCYNSVCCVSPENWIRCLLTDCRQPLS